MLINGYIGLLLFSLSGYLLNIPIIHLYVRLPIYIL